MKIDLSHFRETYLQESAEHVEAMESELLALRSSPSDIELLNAIFRAAHSIKGGAGSFGLNALVRFTHALESMLDKLRSSEMQATDEVIDLLLKSVDVLRALLGSEPEAVLSPEAEALRQRFEQLCGMAVSDEQEKSELSPVNAGDLTIYRVEFRPHADMFLTGNNPLLQLRDLAALGTVSTCELHVDRLPALSSLDPSLCYLWWTIELVTSHSEAEVREVFEFVEHLAEIQIVRLEIEPKVDAENIAMAADHALAPVSPVPPLAKTEPALREQPGRRASASAESGSIRVETSKVDRLIDLVGELVIAQVMTAQIVEEFTPDCLPKLRDAVAAMERNTRELHERVMGVRMLPVGPLFQRYMRTVYDIARSTGKRIRLETEGEETEIDKSMLELLSDPLTHLVRNAADHGIEMPEVRRASGKPEEGVITLRAFHRSGRIVIEIADDGAGIDVQRVRRKAIERGLIAPDAQLNNDELRMLIFAAGFSTRDAVSDLSGRGVGMDVVKRNVEQLNGTVTVRSELGMGSIVSVELPLTLAILEGLLVRVADRTLVLPLLAVVETVAPESSQIVEIARRGEVVVIREESIPLLRVRHFLGLVTDSSSVSTSERELVVVVEAGHKKVGLVVEELLGQQQVVVKSLEKNLRKVGGLMGATILGDGCVAPIVDVAGIASLNLPGMHA
ncbi:chemotaxis protein CheA [Silvibacterium dinghuense]|uniref:Chemotaxis protein CheA n=1 Tax=Silvibacterium dinghuense TaxID=1560006 RepID=A0A4V1NVB0_9BACT|nr:chemotaxis protein CheA [Silvibacterium dinghuense]RXS95140.1 chemotaxis protein CheA [Silvibacterium dinghuense]GGH10970.1 chemotaxis protein CheA [Silvibacterium dinghuense]